MQTNKYAIIVAGGVGSRSGDSLPKQFHDIGGHPMLWWTLKAFEAENRDTKLIVVMHADYIDLWNKTATADCPEHLVVPGGATRTASVAAGLAVVPEDINGLVAVHDAARPLASPELIRESWRHAAEFKAVVPAVPVSDSLREGTKENSHSVDRSRFFAVQTPQVFDIQLLKEAYKSAAKSKGVSFTDDASVVEWYGKSVRLFDGDPRNIKVTYPGDFKIAAEILLQ